MDKERNMETLGQSAAVPVQKGFLNQFVALKFLKNGQKKCDSNR